MSASLRPQSDLPTASLGTRRETPFTYTPGLLEAVSFGSGRACPDQAAWVCLGCLRFSSLCPVTGQPDWAELAINYIPDARVVESKSLKEYLGSFRMHGDFHEDLCRVICDDLVQLLAPRYCEVEGLFDSRGSIAIWPYIQWARPEDAEAQEVLQSRRLQHRPGACAAERGRMR